MIIGMQPLPFGSRSGNNLADGVWFGTLWGFVCGFFMERQWYATRRYICLKT